ncbi:hypothetical protein [Nonomuraea dietziae]|uniref:hypothetical protein n=1 Tax=Nonomuraea dietziae TaxID=65515 RepID=UPI0033D568FB
MRRRLALCAAALVAACVPTAAQASTGHTAAHAYSDPAKDFSACVRANGVQDFPDVTIRGGTLQLGQGVDPFSDRLRTAVKACEHLLPKGTALPTRPTPPELPSTPEMKLGKLPEVTCS